jgi:hypothetical protein
MKKKVAIAMCLAVAIASLLSLGLFLLVTVVLVDHYIEITGRLIHENKETNKALLHLVSQGSVLGGLGGALFVMQLVTNYIAKGKIALLENQALETYFLYALITPLKGLVAGLVGATVIGGSVMLVGGIEHLRNAHLLVISCACIAGYSEQFLQRVVDLANRKIEKL